MSVFPCMYKYRFPTPQSSLIFHCLHYCWSLDGFGFVTWVDNMLILVAVCGLLILRWEWEHISIAACHSRHANLTHSIIKICWLSLIICYKPTLLPNGSSCFLPSDQLVCIYLFVSNMKRSSQSCDGNDNSNTPIYLITGLHPNPSHTVMGQSSVANIYCPQTPGI